MELRKVNLSTYTVYIYCQKYACFCNNNWYIEFMVRTVVDFY